jgi:hypothetical protein
MRKEQNKKRRRVDGKEGKVDGTVEKDRRQRKEKIRKEMEKKKR